MLDVDEPERDGYSGVFVYQARRLERLVVEWIVGQHAMHTTRTLHGGVMLGPSQPRRKRAVHLSPDLSTYFRARPLSTLREGQGASWRASSAQTADSLGASPPHRSSEDCPAKRNVEVSVSFHPKLALASTSTPHVGRGDVCKCTWIG